MLSKDAQGRVNRIIADELEIDPARITSEKSLVEDLGMDSLHAVEIVIGLEKEFKITIPEDEAANLKTVQDIYSYIERCL